MSLRLSKADAQYVILADASFHAAGYVLMIEEYLTDQSGKPSKTYVPVSFGSKILTPTFLKLSTNAKELLVVHFPFDTLAHIIWGSSKPVLVLTEKSLTRFSQAKTIPSGLWTCVGNISNFNFVLGHIPGKANTAADYLSRIQIHPLTKLELRINLRLATRDVSLRMKTQVPDNSINVSRHDCEVLMTNHEFASHLSSLNALHVPNPLESQKLTDCLNPIQ